MGENDKFNWFPVSMITWETWAEEMKKKQKPKMDIARKKNTKQDVHWKMNFFSTPRNPQKDYFDENTNSMFDGNTIMQDEGNIQYNFRKILLKKMRKRLKQKEKKKKTSFFQTCKNNLEREIWIW